jgi:hypothetical protein
MFNWEWESFERLLNGNSFTIVDVGPLRAPIRSFSIIRDEKLELTMETRADQNATSEFNVYLPGTVRANVDTVRLTDNSGVEVVAVGVQPHSWTMSVNVDSPRGELREASSVQSIKGSISPQRDRKYVMDWLANVDDVFVWPDMSDVETEITKTRAFRGGNNEPVLRGSNKNSSGSWNCVKLAVEGYDVFLCAARPATARGVSKPGFILYIGNPSDDFREKIRQCLSFSLGIFFVYLGCSSFCENWLLASFEAVSAYSLDRKAFDLAPMPPSPLGTRSVWEIERDILSRMVNALYSHYDALGFGELSWAYWHAVCATPHIAAVHYGAATEALQRSYLNANEGVLKTKLVDGEEWRGLKASVESAISELAGKDDVKQIMKNKLNDMNTVPASLVTERILEGLHIELGEREKKAWKRRNVAAHGSDTASAEVIELIRDLKILRLRFHRMLLSITKASEFYYDYFSVRKIGDAFYAARRLAEPIP